MLGPAGAAAERRTCPISAAVQVPDGAAAARAVVTDSSVQAADRRLLKLFRVGYLDRFRPISRRGSFPWTYQLGLEGHRLLQRAGRRRATGRFARVARSTTTATYSTICSSTRGCSPTVGPTGRPPSSLGRERRTSSRRAKHGAARECCASATPGPLKGSTIPARDSCVRTRCSRWREPTATAAG